MSERGNKIFLYLAIVILFATGIGCFVYSSRDYKLMKFSFSENNAVNYKVYLKENSYFDTPYLGENRTYITQLIDYIDIDFHYKSEFSEEVDSHYTYQVKATVSANKAKGESGSYWSKDYSLTDIGIADVKAADKLEVNQNVKVDYSKYNEILNNFKKEYSLATDGVLKIYMVIKGDSSSSKYEETIPLNSTLSLDVPLLQQSIEASINTNASNKNQVINIKVKDNDISYTLAFSVGIVFMIISAILVIIAVTSAAKSKRENAYEVRLKKILSSNDSIIANVMDLPKTDNLDIIRVKTFNELLDVYNEVRMPINYKRIKNPDRAVFIIVNESMAWMYVLDRKNMETYMRTKDERGY